MEAGHTVRRLCVGEPNDRMAARSIGRGRCCYRLDVMTQITQLLVANQGDDELMGLHLGEAHVIRNAGGRVTDDVLRSLALSSQVLGVDTVVVMQHTKCGLAGVTDAELRQLTGADLGFFPIDDHAAALKEDIALLAATPYLDPLKVIAGLIYDVESGEVADVAYWERPATP